DGSLIETAPAAMLKEEVSVLNSSWFQYALNKTENIHFTTPYVQNLFVDSDNQYQWVISMSRAAEITMDKTIQQGVLLIDINYDAIAHLFENISLGSDGYTYLMDSEGVLIYHPKHQLIHAKVLQENNMKAATYKDGNHEETFQGEERVVTVKSVGYTGWKIVGVTPQKGLVLNNMKNRIFLIFSILIFVCLLSMINSLITSKITNPIKELEKSVNQLEMGAHNIQIYEGGTYEIQHLGKSIKKMANQIRNLMKDMVEEHESKRKNELNTLQAQINPHFLYNTLDIIVWMIEDERQDEAVRVVTALARFFRISLSKGKTIITVADELEHVRNYLMIQKMRYKNRFQYQIIATPEVMDLATIKLVLQPLTENAIYHGMEFMDGEGEIIIKAYLEEDELYLSVSDNGLGMTPEMIERLLKGDVSSKKGSGIGVKNVNERICVYFGMEYGLRIDSTPDEGTTIIIHLPKKPYDEYGRVDV
ncbi:MAG: sensor histidine kinase, partial [Anaerocolumna sp.]